MLAPEVVQLFRTARKRGGSVWGISQTLEDFVGTDIRRAHLDSASNDIGFARGTDGCFRAILSEYDRSIGYSDRWLGKVQQHYKESQTLAVAKAKGYIFRGKEVVQTPNGPRIRLQFVAR